MRCAGLVVLVLGVACGPGGGAGGPGRDGGGRVVIGVRGDVSSFNIYTATNAFSQDVADLLFPRLAREQADFREGPPSFAPALARSWEFSDDRLELTFRLRDDAVWSDGRPVTADDVVFSFRAARDPAVGWVGRDVKEQILEASAVDAHTVRFRFARAYPYQLMDAVEGNVVPAHVYASTPFEAWPRTAFLDAPVSAGPFRLRRYERGSTIELARDPADFSPPPPRLETVVFRILPDPAALVAELLAGGLDVLPNVATEAVPRIRADGRFEVVRAPDLTYSFICWNTARPPFDDLRVRRALTQAIDRAALVEGLLPLTGRVAAGPVPSLLWAHDPGLEPLPYDPDGAAELLARAGWSDADGDGVLERDGIPFRFELETNQESRLRFAVAEAIAAQLRRVGIEATPRSYEFGAFVTRHERHDFDAFVGSWREATKVDLKSVFHSTSIDGAYNYGSYADAELDAVIDRARVETDAEAARELLWRAQRIVARDQPYTFLYEKDRLHAVARGLRGFAPNPRTVYQDLEQWHWAEDGEAR